MTESPLINLLSLARRARQAREGAELAFMAVNDSHGLTPYRQAALWFAAGGVRALSGVVQPEVNVPYVQWLERTCAALHAQGDGPRVVTAKDLPEPQASEWADWLPAEGLCVPLPGSDGLVLLARDAPWTEQEVVLLVEWFDIWRHAWQGLNEPHPIGWRAHPRQLLRRLNKVPGKPWWKQPAVRWALAVVLVLLIPVRLSVLAPGELVPLEPAVIRAPFDGVVGSFLVKPNEMVKTGQPLFVFDDATLLSRLEVARQGLATAEAEYRQLTQQALADSRFKAQLVVVGGKIEERKAEVEYLQGQFDRSRVVAPRDGIALFDDPSEWVGKPVVTGERVLRVAAPDQVEVEAWLPLADAIPLETGSSVTLYLNSSPLSPVAARLRYVAYDAVQRPDGNFAYRVRARLEERSSHRVGLKGTVKLAGSWVPLVYWVMRRPVATIRQYIGW